MRLMTPEEAELTALSLRPALCSEFHGGSCLKTIGLHFGLSILRALRFYVPLHFLPLLFRLKQVKKECELRRPLKVLLNAAKACGRSTLMLSGMAGLGKAGGCIWLRCVGMTHFHGMILCAAIVSVFATFIESQSKVSEMSLYVLPRFLDAFWNFLKRRGLVRTIPGGRTLMFSIGMSVVAYCYENEVSARQPTVLRGYYQTICKYLLG